MAGDREPESVAEAIDNTLTLSRKLHSNSDSCHMESVGVSNDPMPSFLGRRDETQQSELDSMHIRSTANKRRAPSRQGGQQLRNLSARPATADDSRPSADRHGCSSAPQWRVGIHARSVAGYAAEWPPLRNIEYRVEPKLSVGWSPVNDTGAEMAVSPPSTPKRLTCMSEHPHRASSVSKITRRRSIDDNISRTTDCRIHEDHYAHQKQLHKEWSTNQSLSPPGYSVSRPLTIAESPILPDAQPTPPGVRAWKQSSAVSHSHMPRPMTAAPLQVHDSAPVKRVRSLSPSRSRCRFLHGRKSHQQVRQLANACVPNRMTECRVIAYSYSRVSWFCEIMQAVSWQAQSVPSFGGYAGPSNSPGLETHTYSRGRAASRGTIAEDWPLVISPQQIMFSGEFAEWPPLAYMNPCPYQSPPLGPPQWNRARNKAQDVALSRDNNPSGLANSNSVLQSIPILDGSQNSRNATGPAGNTKKNNANTNRKSPRFVPEEWPQWHPQTQGTRMLLRPPHADWPLPYHPYTHPHLEGRPFPWELTKAPYPSRTLTSKNGKSPKASAGSTRVMRSFCHVK